MLLFYARSTQVWADVKSEGGKLWSTPCSRICNRWPPLWWSTSMVMQNISWFCNLTMWTSIATPPASLSIASRGLRSTRFALTMTKFAFTCKHQTTNKSGSPLCSAAWPMLNIASFGWNTNKLWHLSTETFSSVSSAESNQSTSLCSSDVHNN